MATAPAGEPIGTAYCGKHGGNMDNNRIRPGTRVHLPVRVPGAHLYVGDVHASMGDGEVSGTGVEIGARVHVRIGLEKGKAREWPWLETPDLLIQTASAKTYEEAMALFQRYRDYLVALISDVRFPRNGEEDSAAGFDESP